MSAKRFITAVSAAILFAVVLFGCGDDGNPANSGGGDSQFNPNISYGSFTDSRDGQTYRYVTIGSQTWMAENLNFETSSGSWCYNNETSNCDIYGRLYDWATAMNIDASYSSTRYGTESCGSNCWNPASLPHRGFCPSGWHLPSDAEWTTLVNFVGGSSTAGTKLKSSTGWEPWSGVPFGTDDYGFSALPGGYRWDGSFGNVGYWGGWWSATEDVADDARRRYMIYRYEVVLSNWLDKSNGLSVRCVRE